MALGVKGGGRRLILSQEEWRVIAEELCQEHGTIKDAVRKAEEKYGKKIGYLMLGTWLGGLG